jgi:hypothetical protein
MFPHSPSIPSRVTTSLKASVHVGRKYLNFACALIAIFGNNYLLFYFALELISAELDNGKGRCKKQVVCIADRMPQMQLCPPCIGSAQNWTKLKRKKEAQLFRR